MSSPEEQYKNIREEVIKALIPGDVLVFFYPSIAVEEIEVKKINFTSRIIIGDTNHQGKRTRKKIPFDDFIKYGTMLRKKGE